MRERRGTCRRRAERRCGFGADPVRAEREGREDGQRAVRARAQHGAQHGGARVPEPTRAEIERGERVERRQRVAQQLGRLELEAVAQVEPGDGRVREARPQLTQLLVLRVGEILSNGHVAVRLGILQERVRHLPARGIDHIDDDERLLVTAQQQPRPHPCRRLVRLVHWRWRRSRLVRLVRLRFTSLGPTAAPTSAHHARAPDSLRRRLLGEHLLRLPRLVRTLQPTQQLSVL